MGKRFLALEPPSKTVSHITQISRQLSGQAFWPIVKQLSPDSSFSENGSKSSPEREENSPIICTAGAALWM
jgi:hypothetical protein